MIAHVHLKEASEIHMQILDVVEKMNAHKETVIVHSLLFVIVQLFLLCARILASNLVCVVQMLYAELKITVLHVIAYQDFLETHETQSEDAQE